jgi:CRP/FNR family transcriptional regulator
MTVSQIDCDQCPSYENSAFKDLSTDEIQLLNRCRTTNTYKKKQVIFYEGNKAFGMYCVQQGRLKLYRTSDDGKEQIVRLVGPGSAIGYSSLLSSEPFQVSAECLEDSLVCFIDKSAFMSLLERSPKLARRLLESTCNDLRNGEDMVCRFAQKSVRERVAETLLILKERYGIESKNGILLRTNLSRLELASLSGTVLESLVRHLSEFKSEGLIEIDGRDITILEPSKLLKIVQSRLI